MLFDWQFVFTLFSFFVAFVSVLYARNTAESAKNTFSAEMIFQLYTTYQSKDMRNNLKIVWKIYHRLWAISCNKKEEAINNANVGMLLPQDMAIDYFMKLKVDSPEYNAIQYVNNYWTYVELLLKRKALKPQEILAFTSPRILGFCLPMAKAHRARYPEPNDTDKNIILAYAYKVLCRAKSK